MDLPNPSRFTEAEYLKMEQAGETRHEFVDGFIYAMTGASAAHIDISTNIIALLHGTLRGGACRVSGSDMRIYVPASRADRGHYFYPDITVTCGERKFGDDEVIATLLNPTVIIEVLSPSTELYDRRTKFAEYKKIATMQHYVMVAQDEARIECFTRGETPEAWIFTDAEGLEAALTLPALDVTLQLAEVYEQVTF